jgi:hypothetical protein
VAKEGTDAAGMSPLQRLILDRMREKRWEAKDVEKRGVPHATLHGYMTGKPLSGMPREATRRQLADGLHLTFEVITEAAKDSIGWTSNPTVAPKNPRPEGEIDRHPVGYDLNAELDGLSDEEVESVLAVVRAMKRAKGR